MAIERSPSGAALAGVSRPGAGRTARIGASVGVANAQVWRTASGCHIGWRPRLVKPVNGLLVFRDPGFVPRHPARHDAGHVSREALCHGPAHDAVEIELAELRAERDHLTGNPLLNPVRV